MRIIDEKDVYLHMCEKIEADSVNEHSFVTSLKKCTSIDASNFNDEWETVELLDLAAYEAERNSCHIKYDENVLRAIIRSFKESQAAMIFIHSHSSLDDGIEIDFSDKDIYFEKRFLALAEEEYYTFPICFMVENLKQYKVYRYLDDGKREKVEYIIPYEEQPLNEPEIHILYNEEQFLLYSRSRNSVFEIGSIMAKVIRAIQNREYYPLSTRLAVQKRIYDKLNEVDKVEIIDDPTFLITHKINRLQLMVSMKCNLSCKYCYADGGSYGMDMEYMDSKMIQTIFSAIKEMQINDIHSIMFFGGEPLLAISAINETCNSIEKMVSEGGLKNIPIYTVVTNGTQYNPIIRDVLIKHRIRVTVSIDGPQFINDALRVYKDGRGSYACVEAHIAQMQSDGIEIAAIEATYTKLHDEQGYSPHAVEQFLIDEFSIENIYLGRCNGSKEYDADVTSYDDSNKYSQSQENIWEVNAGIQQKGKITGHKCAAGIANLTILPNGDLYPCHSFIHNETYKMGNICSLFSEHSYFDRIVEELRKDNKKHHKECQNCWAQMICKGCPADKLKSSDAEIKKSCFDYRQILDCTILAAFSGKNDKI